MEKNDGYSAKDIGNAVGKAASKVSNVGNQAMNDVHSDEAQDVNEQVAQQAGEDAKAALQGAADLAEAPGRIADTAENIKEGTKGAVNAAKKIGNAIKNAPKNISNAIKATGRAIKNAPKNIASAIKNAPKNLANGVKATGRAIKNAPKNLANGVKKAGKALKNAPKNVWKAIKNSPAAIFRKLTKKIRAHIRRLKKTLELMGRAIKGLFHLIKGAAHVLFNIIMFLVSNPVGWVIDIVIVAAILICVLCYNFMDTESVTGDMITDSESISEINQTKVDDLQNVIQVDVSSGTKIISAYYTYFSTKSLWILFDGTVYNCREETTSIDKSIVSSLIPKETITVDGVEYEICQPIQYGSEKFIEIFKYDPFTGSGTDIEGAMLIQDKYERESSFYLSAEAIASIDDTLNSGQFRYPEQIVQKVKYKVVVNEEDGTYHFELDQLADANGRLYLEDVYDDEGKLLHQATLSTAYTQDESKTEAKFVDDKHAGLWIPYVDSSGKVSKKVAGVWDYGFGSILHYMKYIEAHEDRGEVKSFEVLDKNEWNFTTEGQTHLQSYTINNSTVSGAYGNYYSPVNATSVVKLYKKGNIKTYSYAEWNALDEAKKANIWAGDGSATDPTSSEFNKERIYGLPDTESYMIDWVVTPAGTITTNVQTVWKDSGKAFTQTENDPANPDSDERDKVDITYSNIKMDMQTVEHMGTGVLGDKRATATFDWNSSCVNLSSGTLTTNPKTYIYTLRYVPCEDADVNSKYSYTEFTEGGTSGYYIVGYKQEIKMFNDDGTCKSCGKKACESKTVYYKYDHSGCYSTSFSVPKYSSETSAIKLGTQTYYGTYKYVGSKKFNINSNTGAVTGNPYVAVPDEYYTSTSEFSEETTTYYMFNFYTHKCNVCGGSAAYADSYYEMVDHSKCTTVKYEYDVIKTEEVSINNKDYGIDGGSIQLVRFIEGTQWDKEPTYKDEPSMEGIEGKKYYSDYFNNYETYIPSQVQGDFDFDEIMKQTGLTEEELLKLLEREPVASSIATLSYEDYFEGGTSNVEVNDDGLIPGYIGPGFGLVWSEAGGFQPNEYGDADFPSYGTCQMIEGTVKGFYNWICKDPDREALWDKIFNGTDIVCQRNSAFTEAWKNSDKTLTTDEYVTWGIYQLTYMYYTKSLGTGEAPIQKQIASYGIDPLRSRALQEFCFAVSNQGWSPSWGTLNINSSSTDADIINAVCDVYSSINVWVDHLNDTMHYRWGVTLRNHYLELAETCETEGYGLLEWDEEKECFVSDGSSSSSGGWNIKRLWKKLIGAKEDSTGKLYYPWQKVFENSQTQIKEYTTSNGIISYGTDANSAIERLHYRVNAVTESDVDWEIAKIFATIDKVPVSTYKVTDDFFILKYQNLFSTTLGRKWSSTKTGLRKYLPDGYSSVFRKSKESTDENETDIKDIEYTLLNEYDKDKPVLKALVVYGASETPEEEAVIKKNAISIHSVSDGTVIKLGNDVTYGGNYILVQYRNCVVYYGGLSPRGDLAVGDKVSRQEVIGALPPGSYFYIAMKDYVDGNYIDCTRLLKGGLDDPSKVPLYNQMDYPDVYWGGSHGSNTIAASGCGPTSVAMVLSYLFEEEITPVDVASAYGEYYYQGAGASWALFPDSGADYGIEVISTSSWDKVEEALMNGQVAISIQHAPSLFTGGGHFIVLTGMSDDGLVYVNDPNGYNYNKMPDKFETGFEPSEIYSSCNNYWIYPEK